MNHTASEDGRLNGVLVGGPHDLPDEVRACQVRTDDRRVKIAHCGGYEHFERVGDVAPADGPVVFEWVTRTRIAE